MGPVGTLGALLQLSAMFCVLSLYRILRYGKLLHLLPYCLWALGAAILISDKGAPTPISASVIMLGLIALLHGAVYFDIRKTERR